MKKRILHRFMITILFTFIFMGLGLSAHSVNAQAKTIHRTKTVKMYKGKSKKLKIRELKKAKKISIKNAGKSKLKVSRKSKVFLLLKAKKTGTVKIRLKFKVGKKRYIYLIKVKIKKSSSAKGKGSSSDGNSSNSNRNATSKTNTGTSVVTKYNYEVTVVSQGTLYDSAYIYVKTDNPDWSFYFERDDINVTSKGSRFDNISYIGSEGRVKGGYLVSVMLEENADNELTLYESSDDAYGTDTGIRIKIHTGDSSKDEDAYVEKMILKAKKNIESKISNGFCKYDLFYKNSEGKLSVENYSYENLSENQLIMSELRNMILDEYIYIKSAVSDSGKQRVITLFGTDDKKSWESKCINCLEATRIMRAFATKLGLKSEMTYAGYLSHYYATVTIDGKEWIFDATPVEETGYIEDNSWEMLDFSKITNNSNATIAYR